MFPSADSTAASQGYRHSLFLHIIKRMDQSQKFNSIRGLAKVVKLFVRVETSLAAIHTPETSLNRSTDLRS